MLVIVDELFWLVQAKRDELTAAPARRELHSRPGYNWMGVSVIFPIKFVMIDIVDPRYLD